MSSANGETPHHERYLFFSPLGSGAAGRVWKAQYIGTEPLGSLQPGAAVAIKLVPRDKVSPNEVLLQATLKHLNIVQLHDIFECVGTCRGHLP